ncbi:hypothetical protein scyTo_0001929, partial [Scyliorhinus torazame]|nr:hypothetical protein [Scyliorhinus torazame]
PLGECISQYRGHRYPAYTRANSEHIVRFKRNDLGLKWLVVTVTSVQRITRIYEE